MEVYKAISAVMAELSKEGITKTRKNQQQGYNFRGIDDVYNALSSALSKNGLVMLPRVLSREFVERQTKSGGALFYITVDMEFDLVSSVDGSKHTIKTYGEAMDSADKATNKAMSAAYKYAAMQAFCIPTEGDNDADAVTHEVAAKPAITPTAGAWEAQSPENQAFLQGKANEVIALINEGDVLNAWNHLEAQKLDADDKTAIWSRFDSKQRSALKKAKEAK